MADLFWALVGLVMWLVVGGLGLFTLYLWGCHILHIEDISSPAVVAELVLHRWYGRPSPHCRMWADLEPDRVRQQYRTDCGMTGERGVLEQTHPHR